MTLLIATRNLHKVEEIRAMLPEDLGFLTLRDFPDAPRVIEDADTFSGNATKKAVELARWLSASGSHVKLLRRGGRLFVLADDSGLEVDALHGAPGVHSARFAASESGGTENAPDAANNSKLLNLLKEVPAKERTARFHCVIALTPVLETVPENRSSVCYADEAEWQTELFNGVCEGQIGFAPQGEKGFGYDPLFLPAGFHQTFAELGDEVKNQISHRAQALAKLAARLRSLPAN